MRAVVLLLVLLMLFSACNDTSIVRPQWLNGNVDLSEEAVLVFRTDQPHGWRAYAKGLVQTVPLQVVSDTKGLTFRLPPSRGFIDGPAWIVLTHGDRLFAYRTRLELPQGGETHAHIFRSPKTLNADSLTPQQQIAYTLDAWQNIITNGSANYFKEWQVSCPTKAGTYFGAENDPMTAYYVQPGSPRQVPLAIQYDTEKEAYHVQVGPMYDRFGNVIADQTLVALRYGPRETRYTMEVFTIEGIAKGELPAFADGGTLFAEVNGKRSRTLQLHVKP